MRIPSDVSRHYWCFISYRHLDNQDEGREWATWLHHALESYRVPTDLVGRENERGETIPERIFPVFRDEEELPGGDLASNINRALQATRALIVICSPRTRQSKYVAEEIRTYKHLRAKEASSRPQRAEPIVAVIAGDPVDPTSPAYSIPDELRYEVDLEGTLTGHLAPETLWTDLRLDDGAQGWTSPVPYRSALESTLGLSPQEVAHRVEAYSSKIDAARLRIIAGVLGVPLGTLQRRDEAYRLAETRKQLVESSLALGTGAAAPTQRIRWLWRALYSLDDGDPRVDAASGLLSNLAIDLPNPLFHDRRVTQAAFMPGDVTVVTGGDEGTVRFWAGESGHPDEPALAHEDPVTRLCVSPSGVALIVGTTTGTVHVYDAATRELLYTLNVGADPISVLEFDSTGTYFLAQSGHLGESVIAVYDVDTGKVHSAWSVMEEVFRTSAVAISPTGGLVLQGGWGGQLWEPGAPRPALREQGPNVEQIRYSPTGDRFLVLGGTEIQLWDADSFEQVATLSHDSTLLTATFSADGKQVAAGSSDGVALVWSGASGDAAPLSLRHDGPVNSVAFSPDASLLATGGDDELARCWSIPEGRLVDSLRCDSAVRATSFDGQGRRVVVTSDDHCARLWSPGAARRPAARHVVRHGHEVHTVALQPDGHTFLTTSADGTARIWDAATFEPITEPLVQDPHESLSRSVVAHAAYSPDGTMVATGAAGSIELWDARSGDRLFDTLRHRFEMWALRFSPDSKRFAATGRYGATQIWDAQIGEPDGEPLLHEGPRAGNAVYDVAFSPDGRLVATAGENANAMIWSLDDRSAPLAVIRQSRAVLVLAFAPDGRWLATGCRDGTARVWDAHTGMPVTAPLAHGDAVSVVQFSPEGKLLLTGSHDRTVRLWDPRTGSPTRGPLRHAGYIAAARFRDDGTMFVTADGAGIVRVWESRYGAPVTPPLEHPRSVGDVTFGRRGRTVLTACSDGHARLWRVVPDDVDQPDRLRWYSELKTGWRLDAERMGIRLDFEEWSRRLG